MTALHTFFCIGLFSLLIGCASTPSITKIKPGMSPSEVEQVMGAPKDRNFEGNREVWVYHTRKDQQKIAIFENNRLVELKTLDPNQKAPSPQQAKSKPSSLEDGYCTEKNRFGRYPKGGGCNMFGCWPAGGYCNQFGCTASGYCTVRSCPKPIKSFRCH